MLKIENFSKTYPGGNRAVDHLSLEVRPGDVFGFIGHNGAGKTTTIRAITGVMDFSEGNIWVDGESVRENPLACKRKIAFVPDNPDLYDYLTGIQYLNFVADIFGMDAVSYTHLDVYKRQDSHKLTKLATVLGAQAGYSSRRITCPSAIVMVTVG